MRDTHKHWNIMQSTEKMVIFRRDMCSLPCCVLFFFAACVVQCVKFKIFVYLYAQTITKHTHTADPSTSPNSPPSHLQFGIMNKCNLPFFCRSSTYSRLILLFGVLLCLFAGWKFVCSKNIKLIQIGKFICQSHCFAV